MTTNVVIQGHGPHVRFKATGSMRQIGTGSLVRVVTSRNVQRVPLSGNTDLKFRKVA